jgi:hypothetical protein
METIIGNEYDLQLINKLNLVIEEMGGKFKDELTGIAGSQELHQYHAYILDSKVVIEIETYIGIKISGKESIINEILQKLNLTTAST